ncbi:IclR family transcriptional regulator [Morganella morganii]|uniref:IclR family transcriptional regulator n=1 Tax=Morganella morganii TaxID=582 RepID=UPI002858C35F|nr:IclR family transcriptional regulator [Morganella morganii]MDR5684971.1 IclR family transcriptional regulator [Morganella morganii]
MNQRKYIQSVERAMLLLETLVSRKEGFRLAELSEQFSLNKTTLHGLLATLSSLGYVSRRGQYYVAGLRVRDIARPLTDSDQQLREQFTPALRRLSVLSGETCWLAVPCGTREYLYIDAIEGGNSLRVASPRGTREGLITSAIGRIFLAFHEDLARTLRKEGLITGKLNSTLSLIAECGYALDIEEAEKGLNCMALPLRQHGYVVAAMGVAGPSNRLHPDYLRRLAVRIMRDMFDIIKL